MPVSGGAPRRAGRVAPALVLGFCWLAFAGATCGGRSELDVPPPLPPQPECDVHEDCPGFDDKCKPTRCVDPKEHVELLPELPPGVLLPPLVCLVIDPIDCEDNDPCTADTCMPETGECSYGPATFDIDEDGHRAPRAGTIPGDPDACGDDCNDASAAAFPGNPEICDGVDNDCNGIVDDGATFVPLSAQPVRISSDPLAPAEAGGLAFNGESYMSIYTSVTGFDMYQTRLLPDGTKVDPIEEKFTFQNADSGGGPIEWIGDRYGIAWQDRRDGDWESYFAILKPDGGKAFPDTRLSVGPDFSVNVGLTWTGNEFIVVWQDRRNGVFQVMAQRVSIDSVPIGGNATLTEPGGLDDESPSLASGDKSVGLVYTNGLPGSLVIRFRSYHPETLEPLMADSVELTDGSFEAVYPSIIWNHDRYIVTWYEKNAPVNAVYAATISEDGTVMRPRTAVSQPGNARSRYPTLLALGDRVLFVYADDRDFNDGYELYTRMVSSDLVPLGPEMRITMAGRDSISPVAAFGLDGDVGILFRDDRDQANHVWFTRLGCVVP